MLKWLIDAILPLIIIPINHSFKRDYTAQCAVSNYPCLKCQRYIYLGKSVEWPHKSTIFIFFFYFLIDKLICNVSSTIDEHLTIDFYHRLHECTSINMMLAAIRISVEIIRKKFAYILYTICIIRVVKFVFSLEFQCNVHRRA